MKVRIIYTEAFEIDVTPDEIAALLEPDADDTAISDAIASHIDVIVTEREWPSYRTEIDDLGASVREAMKAAEEEAAEEDKQGEVPS